MEHRKEFDSCISQEKCGDCTTACRFLIMNNCNDKTSKCMLGFSIDGNGIHSAPNEKCLRTVSQIMYYKIIMGIQSGGLKTPDASFAMELTIPDKFLNKISEDI